MILQKYIRTIGRCLLSLTIICFSLLIANSQEQQPDKLAVAEGFQTPSTELSKNQTQTEGIQKKQIPTGLFTYNKWVDLNEDGLAESSEFFGLGKDSFSKGEPISASLYDPKLNDGTNLKIRVWDTSGNLIRTIRKKYSLNPMFTYSGFDSYLPVGEYIMTINPDGSGETYQIRFLLKEPNGSTFAKIRKKLLPENLHLFKQWIDEDGDMKLDSAEVFGLNQYTYNIGEVKFELGLNLPVSTDHVVYQVWNSADELLSMNISRLDSLQHFTMKSDSLNRGNEFLQVLKSAPAGDYKITASVSGEELIQYQVKLQIVDSSQTITETVTEELAEVSGVEMEVLDEVSEMEVVKDTVPEEPRMAMGISVDVDNLAPEFKKGQEGFFLFSGFIDLNENEEQDKDEFLGTNQDYFYSESENVFVQFHLRQFFNKNLSLQILNKDDELVLEQKGVYKASPFVFKVSMPDEPLIPGDYTLAIHPEGSDVKYQIQLVIK